MINSNAAAKSMTLKRHKAAFGLWFHAHQILEDAVIRGRDLRSPFAGALDLMFIQGFKSHGSLYSLCILGHCEDAATIARRIFEIALQVGYLDSEDSEQENRGRQYLAYFLHLIPKGILANPAVSSEDRRRWEKLYRQHKQWLKFTKSGAPAPSWSGLGVADLANKLKLQQAYNEGYRFLSNMAHASSAGSLLRLVGGEMQITDDTAVTPILVYGTRYMLAAFEIWNGHFGLVAKTKLTDLRNRCLTFAL